MIPFSQVVRIRTLPDAIDDAQRPQLRQPGRPDYVGSVLEKLGVKLPPLDARALGFDAPRQLGV